MMNEKNLKKMDDCELDIVAGGNMAQTAEDSALLYAYNLLDDYHGSFHMTFHWESDSAAVDAGWSKAGITCVSTPGRKGKVGNKYFLDGKEITRNEAINHLKTNFKQIREIP